MSAHPQTYKAYAFTEKEGKLEKIDVPWKDPEEGEIVAKVLACGVCGSDEMVPEQTFGFPFPRVPGHEIIGTVAAVHPNEKRLKIGDRIGAGWHGGHCHACKYCLRGDFLSCVKSWDYTNGIATDGGYAEYVTLRTEAVCNVPEDLDPAEAAPILCAGITAFNSIRHMNLGPGDIVAIQGIGGIGHLALQYSKAMGYRTAAISSSSTKEALSRQLGADYYIDQSATPDVAKELQELGGAKVIMVTAPSSKAISELLGGLDVGGQLLIIALPREPVSLPLIPFVAKRLSMTGWGVGTPADSEDCLNFGKHAGVKCMVQAFPLDKAQEAYDHRASARFRAVIVPSLAA